MIFLRFFVLFTFLQTFCHVNCQDDLPPFRNADELQPWHHLHERSYKMPPFNLWIGTAMHDGVPFLFTNRNTHQQAIFCIHPKAGSSLFKYLLRYGMLKRRDDLTLTEILHQSAHSWQTGRTPEIQQAFRKQTVPRIMIVRNPYIRLLSGYLEKIIVHKEFSYGPPDYRAGESYEIFMNKLIKQHENPDIIDFNNHFKLMSKNCLLNDGMSYDYYLPLEQMDYWYESLIDSLDLQVFTEKGWNITTPEYHGVANQECFYTTFNKTCDMMFQKKKEKKKILPLTSSLSNSSDKPITTSTTTTTTKNTDTTTTITTTTVTTTVITKSSKKSKIVVDDGALKQSLFSYEYRGNRTVHFTGSIDKLEKYYTTPALIRKTTDWVMPDLLEYKYPIWSTNLTAKEYVEKIYFDMPQIQTYNSLYN